jgi:exopolysaccharide production protein ExoY
MPRHGEVQYSVPYLADLTVTHSHQFSSSRTPTHSLGLNAAPSRYRPILVIRKRSAVGGIRKRCFDVIAACTGLLLLSPLFLLIAVIIKLADGGPTFYGHRRIGRNGAYFSCLKFRTMVPDADAVLEDHLANCREAAAEWQAWHKLKDDPRITPLGIVLRKTSLDELPQLLNILKGEMSVVGPRPIVRAEVAKYGEAIEQYLSTRPGLTGLWQISGRNDVDYIRRVALDRRYVQEWSFKGDLRIVQRTFAVVLLSRGCY